MKLPMIPPLPSPALLVDLLKNPLEVINVEEHSFPGGWTTPDEVIVSARYLLLLEGMLRYRVEGQTVELHSGMQLLVPSWVRRQWTVPPGHRCHLIWCEFTTAHSGRIAMSAHWGKTTNSTTEEAMYRRLIQLHPGRRLADGVPPEITRLHLEAEVKASLARFWPGSEGFGVKDGPIEGETHPWIRSALGWLEEHYRRADALEAFYDQLTASPNHFRLLFRQAGLGTVQGHLARLRMRRARYLIHETDLSLKEIAAETGFNDPLFFSRQYRKYWKHAPSVDRQPERSMA